MAEFLHLPLDQIHVKRDERQRRNVELTDDFIESIRIRGVLQPIIVEHADGIYTLIAGERRYTASLQLKLQTIPARLFSSLTPFDRQIIELEENVKRRDITWQEQAEAVSRIHNLCLQQNPNHTQSQTGELCALPQSYISRLLAVQEAIEAGNTNLKTAPSITTASNVIYRKESRLAADAINELLAPTVPSIIETPTSNDSILNLDFIQWAPTYNGPPFNFIHCDFPYGINIDASAQAGSVANTTRPQLQQAELYADSAETYWALCEALAINLNRLMAPSAHLMFWFSMEYYNETLAFFRTHTDLEIQPFPLIWHKTDNRGILPDFKRGPRRVYETAFIASRGDRQIVKPIGNCYGAPTSKEIHQSEKPEPMLKYFFQMFVDETSRVFDPTAGSGTSLRAAEFCGASHVFGLELNPTYCEAANKALAQARRLKELTA